MIVTFEDRELITIEIIICHHFVQKYIIIEDLYKSSWMFIFLKTFMPLMSKKRHEKHQKPEFTDVDVFNVLSFET